MESLKNNRQSPYQSGLQKAGQIMVAARLLPKILRARSAPTPIRATRPRPRPVAVELVR
jgi:hypothetical protein